MISCSSIVTLLVLSVYYCYVITLLLLSIISYYSIITTYSYIWYSIVTLVLLLSGQFEYCYWYFIIPTGTPISLHRTFVLVILGTRCL